MHQGTLDGPQLPAERTQPEGTLKTQLKSALVFPGKSSFSSVTLSGKNSPGVLLAAMPSLPLKQNATKLFFLKTFRKTLVLCMML